MHMASLGSYVLFVISVFASSYAGAFFQLIIGLMGVFGLCNFIHFSL
jgi:hypothetical protein